MRPKLDRPEADQDKFTLKQALAEETRTREALLFMLEDLANEREVIKEARRNWINTVDAIGDPLMVHDAELRILRANRAYAERAGVGFPELIGRSYWECFPKGAGPLAHCKEQAAQTQPGGEREPIVEEFTADNGAIYVSRAFVSHDRTGRFRYALHIFEDVTEQRQADRALNRANRALRTLSAGNAALVRAADEPGLLAEMCRVIVSTGGYESAWVGYGRDDARKSIDIMGSASAGTPRATLADAIRESRLSWGDTGRAQGTVGAAIRTCMPQLLRDVWEEPQLAPWRAALRESATESVLALPLRIEASRTCGVLSIASADAEAFDLEELKLLEELAGDLAYGIETLRTREAHAKSDARLQRGMEETIQAIAATLEMRDPYTAGHQKRVANLATAIAREVGLDDGRIRGLHLAATVHDIGKIRIPAEILAKPTALTRIEFEIIKTHAQASYEILKDVDFPWPIAEIVRQHHERLDGSGYPQGLKAEAILPEAKILAVADMVEAMSSSRPYRPSRGVDAALGEIGRRRGTHYDETAVDACLRLFQEKRFAFTA